MHEIQLHAHASFRRLGGHVVHLRIESSVFGPRKACQPDACVLARPDAAY